MKMKTTALLLLWLIPLVLFADPIEQDKAVNHPVIREKAKSHPAYLELMDLAEQYDLFIGIREFKIGDKARHQPKEYHGSYKWKYLSGRNDAYLDTYVKHFVKYFKRVPQSLVQKLGLKGVVFVRDLSFAGMKVGGGFGLEEMILFINVHNYHPEEQTVAHTYLHEFFHMMQNKFYSVKGFVDYDHWRTLNKTPDVYYPGGALQMIRQKGAGFDYFEGHPKPGFVTQYAQADVWHDVTETFVYLWVDEYYENLNQWMKEDPWLRKKVEYLFRCLNALDGELEQTIKGSHK